MATAISLPASTFRKVLKGFEIGGLPYTDVQFHLKRLLAAGTSPEELQEVLRRCELITPLPDYAHAEVVRLLDEARDGAAAQAAEPAPELGSSTETENESASDLAAELKMTRRALAAEQGKTQEISRALAERIGSEQAARARSEDVRRESEHYQGELRNARNLLSTRDAVIAQMRVSLDEGNAQIAALRKEHAAASTTLDSRGKNVVQLQMDLEASRTRAATLGAELAAARAALESEQRRRQEIERASVDKLALNEAVLSRRSHAERDAQLASLRLGHEKAAAVLETRAKTLEGELQMARKRIDAMAADLRSSQDAASAIHAQNDRLTAQLRTGQSDQGAARAERDSLRAQVAALQSKLNDNEALVDKLQQSVRSNAQRAAELQAAAMRREPERIVPERIVPEPIVPERFAPERATSTDRIASPELGDIAPASAAVSRSAPLVEITDFLPAPTPVKPWKPGPLVRVIGVGAAIAVLALVTWLIARRPAAPAQAPAVVAAAIPQAGTVLRDCPTCPAVTVLPAGRFEQGSKYTDIAASPFEKPAHVVAIHYPFAMSTNAVTVDEFRAFVTATGRDMQGGCDIYDGNWRRRPDSNWENPGFAQTGSHPVTCASWNDAKAYAAWLSKTTGHRYRLPSASEWEYAARAGTAAVLPWSEASGACSAANVADQSAARRYPGWTVFGCDDGFAFTAPVGSFKANAFGLNDMLGNVFQWTEDCWRADYVGAPIDGSALTGGDCSDHELRGGSWFSTPAYVRANYRNHFAADYRTSSVGFRLVREVT
jgi:sulfatase modifying factor 1